MNDKSYSLKTRKILRFCKENNLYWYLQNKFKNIEFLNSVLHYSSFEDSLIEIFTFLPYGYKHSFKSVNINVNFYNKKWKTFVKDCELNLSSKLTPLVSDSDRNSYLEGFYVTTIVGKCNCKSNKKRYGNGG